MNDPHWSQEEIDNFKKFNEDRLSGKLGNAIRFANTDELMNYLKGGSGVGP